MATLPRGPVSWPIPNDLVGRILTHIAETGEPEGIPELHPGPIDKNEPFRIRCDISIPRGKRADGQMAPCPMCQSNKFLEGRLVWFGRLQEIAVIGHYCANKETNREAERDRKARDAKERAINFLIDALAQLPQLRAEIESTRPSAIAAQDVFDSFKSGGATFQAALRHATKNGGVLSVAEVIGPRSGDGPAGLRTAGSTVDTRDVHFGALSGMRAVATRCRVRELLESAESIIAKLASITDDTALGFLEELSDPELVRWERDIRAVQNKLIELRDLVHDIASFFTTENASRISRWGSHKDAPIRLRATLSQSKVREQIHFELVAWPSNRRVGLLLPPALFARPWSPGGKGAP